LSNYPHRETEIFAGWIDGGRPTPVEKWQCARIIGPGTFGLAWPLAWHGMSNIDSIHGYFNFLPCSSCNAGYSPRHNLQAIFV
jgi:hypothetical protein